MSKSDHFTAVVEINRTFNNEEDGGYNKPKIVTRQVAEVSKLVLRADSLGKLQTKLSAHIALIED